MEAMKPVFVGRAERERLALERLKAAAVSDQQRSGRSLRCSDSSVHESSSSERHVKRDWNRDQDYYSLGQDKKRGRDECSRKRRQREGDEQQEKVMELEAIREHYLPGPTKKKRVIKPSGKFRFSFSWDSTEDTSNAQWCPHDESRGLLFGRGFLAGIDRRQQKKEAEARAQQHRRNNSTEEHHAEKKKKALLFDTRVERHWTQKTLEEMTERDWRVLRDHFEISYKQHGGGGGGSRRVPPPNNNNHKPMRKWSESTLGPDLLRAVHSAGYSDPSPIQRAAIPLGLQQRDVIGVAETGSGKTAAFVLPMLSYITTRLPPISGANRDQGPYALVLVPTRELAQQIEAETLKLARYLERGRVKVMSIVGGGHQDIRKQASRIADEGCEIVIATPGRLLDLLNNRYVVLNQCNYVVLDEADRMLADPVFEQQVVGVLDAMPSTNLKPRDSDEELDEKRIYRTTYMFSATMPPAVERLARKYLRNPVVVTIGTAGMATDLVTQNVVMVKSEAEKMTRLRNILLGDRNLVAGGDNKQAAVIVFCNTRRTVDMRAEDLEREGFRVTTLHGGMSQQHREDSLDGFRNRRFSVLVATDLAARGIDVPDVSHVMNYEMPRSIESYTHRIGRTGRAGKKGVATSFLTLQDTDIFYHLKQMLVQSNNHVPPELARHKASRFKPGSVPNTDRAPRHN